MTESGSKGDDNPCNEIVIEIDCSKYPEGVPYFHMDSSPKTWTVNSTARDQKKYRRYKLESSTAEFTSNIDNIDHPIVKYTGKLLGRTAKELCDMEKTGVRKALKALKSAATNKALDLHHLLPVWLGGDNDGNLIPIGDDDHDKVHEWWNDKLKEENENFLDKIEECTKRAANSGDKQKENAMKRARKKKRGDGEIDMNLNEINSTSLAANLKEAGIELKIKMDCPCAVPSKRRKSQKRKK